MCPAVVRALSGVARFCSSDCRSTDCLDVDVSSSFLYGPRVVFCEAMKEMNPVRAFTGGWPCNCKGRGTTDASFAAVMTHQLTLFKFPRERCMAPCFVGNFVHGHILAHEHLRPDTDVHGRVACRAAAGVSPRLLTM